MFRKAVSSWSSERILPFVNRVENGAPYICRLAPSEKSICVEVKCPNSDYSLYLKERQGGEWKEYKTAGNTTVIEGLKERCEYCIVARGAEGKSSLVRLFRTSDVPGAVVTYLHPEDSAYGFSGRYTCSPSLLTLPSGAMLASCDIFNGNDVQNLTLVFRSDDGGKSWYHHSEISPCFWGKMFLANGDLYMIGASTEYGDLLIGKSCDEGKTWSMPTVLIRGSCTRGQGCHRAPCNILYKNGKIYTSLEYGSWSRVGFANIVISANEDADLLDPESWRISEACHTGFSGVIEGNLVEGVNGEIFNFLRYEKNHAILLVLNEETGELTFKDDIAFPMAHTKFEILRHENGTYYAAGNNPHMGRSIRNQLSIYKSKDLYNWEFVKHVIDAGDCDPDITGFQYPSFEIHGNSFKILSRTAWGGAKNFHDANHITYHEGTLE